MKILPLVLRCLQVAIFIALALLLAYLAWINVWAYEVVLIRLGASSAIAVWIGAAIFVTIQAYEVRPIVMRRLHNKVSELLDFLEGLNIKPLAIQFKEEKELLHKRMIRALWLAGLFTLVDLGLCVFFLFTPIVKPGTNISVILMTMNTKYIVWENVWKTLGTVWLIPIATKLLLSESEQGFPSFKGIMAGIKSKLGKPGDRKAEEPKSEQKAKPMQQPVYYSVPLTQPAPTQQPADTRFVPIPVTLPTEVKEPQNGKSPAHAS